MHTVKVRTPMVFVGMVWMQQLFVIVSIELAIFTDGRTSKKTYKYRGFV